MQYLIFVLSSVNKYFSPELHLVHEYKGLSFVPKLITSIQSDK